jgi:two-component system cell cycle sensor histidine kinase/response regulator CckA
MDPSQVDQILANLATNARDAMPDGGRLSVDTSNVSIDGHLSHRHPDMRPGDYVRLAVSDTGAGMSDETRERAFEPFYTTKGEGKGTGLGLSTVYGVVRQNDGFADIESVLGSGTTVTLYLPRSSQEAIAARAPASAPAANACRETILLVEDQPQLRAVTSEVLQDLGYTILDAGTPADALALCAAHASEIHLLFTDVVMPGMNGKELADRVLRLRPGIRTLFTSGYTADTIGPRGVLQPGVHFLEKPFSMDAVARKVREVLDGA